MVYNPVNGNGKTEQEQECIPVDLRMLLETKRKRSRYSEFLPQYYDEELVSGSRGCLVRLYFVKLSTEPACQPN